MAKVWIKGYTRADGVHVDGHYRELAYQQIARQYDAADTKLRIVRAKFQEAIKSGKYGDDVDKVLKNPKIARLFNERVKLEAKANSLMRAQEALSQWWGRDAVAEMRKGKAYLGGNEGFFMPKKKKK